MRCCCVRGCASQSSDHEVSFFRFPKVNERFFTSPEHRNMIQRRREAWFDAVPMKERSITINGVDNCRICSKHFKSGKPSDFRAIHDADWIPSVAVNREEAEALKSGANHSGIMTTSIHGEILSQSNDPNKYMEKAMKMLLFTSTRKKISTDPAKDWKLLFPKQ